jgi:hypothetical protein
MGETVSERYTSIGTIEVVGLGGYVNVSYLDVCNDCGSVVNDTEKHDGFHDEFIKKTVDEEIRRLLELINGGA